MERQGRREWRGGGATLGEGGAHQATEARQDVRVPTCSGVLSRCSAPEPVSPYLFHDSDTCHILSLHLFHNKQHTHHVFYGFISLPPSLSWQATQVSLFVN